MRKLLETLASIGRTDTVDFSEFKFYTPPAVAATLAILEKAKSKILPSHSQQPAYLQRIDFFRILRPNMEFPEPFTRHPAKTFTPIQTISRTASEISIAKTICADVITNVQERKRSISSSASDNIRNALTYSIGEIVRNVRQHAGANGFIYSQYIPSTDVIHIGIADCGMGILESFKSNNSEFFDPKVDNDTSMLQKALCDRTSSKFNILSPYGAPENQGVGLTRVSAICELLYGRFFIASGSATYYKDGSTPGQITTLKNSFPGTVVGIEFPSFQLDNYPFNELISEAENPGGTDTENRFEELFI